MEHTALGGSRGARFAPLLVLAALLLAAGGCSDDEVLELGAQGTDSTAVPVDSVGTVADSLVASPADSVIGEFAAATTDSGATLEGSDDDAPGDPPPAEPARPRVHAAEDPEFAARMGWPVEGPAPLPGAILPDRRIVCYYGNPNSTRMGALGQYPKDEMLSRLRNQIAAWERADPSTPVMPCLHMIAVVAQGAPGTAGHYRSIMLDETVQMVYDWARELGGIFIVDMQVGTDDIRNILPRFEWILRNPDVHLAIDPEFYMKDGSPPGRRIGTMDAADINYAADFLANLVREHNLPPKILVIHRFTRRMVSNYQQIRLRPEVQIVLHMDGWGAPWLKRDSYRDYIVREPVQYTGFKLFYHNDTKDGAPLMQPEDVLRLQPTPVYIQYQ